MVLNIELPMDDVISAHIIEIKDRKILAILGLPDAYIWDERNGILVHKEVEDAKKKFEVVCETFSTNS